MYQSRTAAPTGDCDTLASFQTPEALARRWAGRPVAMAALWRWEALPVANKPESAGSGVIWQSRTHKAYRAGLSVFRRPLLWASNLRCPFRRLRMSRAGRAAN